MGVGFFSFGLGSWGSGPFFLKMFESLNIFGFSRLVLTKNMLDGDQFWTILFSFVRQKHK